MEAIKRRCSRAISGWKKDKFTRVNDEITRLIHELEVESSSSDPCFTSMATVKGELTKAF